MKIYHSNTEVLDILVDDSSVRYRGIMGDNSLTLNFSTVEPVDVPIGAYCDFEGQRYTLYYPENFKKHNTRNFEYTLVLHGNQEALKLFKFKDLSAKPYRLKFPLTATPQVFLQLLVDNMNEHSSGWSAGSCIEADDKLISFNHEYCYDVLNRIAQEFNTEWEIENKTIHLRKVEKYKDDPLALNYGKGNGFKSGVGRTNEGDKQPIGRLYVQGGERNIDYSTYGSQSLLLPKSATLEYDDKVYGTDADGMYITRNGNSNPAEDSYDAADIYPKRVGTVSSVIEVDAEEHFYDIIDSSIPESLNYRDCRIAGEKATIIFQSGALAGREFDIQQTDTELTGYDHEERKFEIVPAEMDGMIMPGGVFVPQAGDKYAIFNISMPQAYISDDESKEGASWDMFREAVRYFAENEEARFSFRGELDGVWSRNKWLEIGGKIVPGGYVLFSDPQFQPDGLPIRIISIKDYINKPHKPEITLSNAPISTSFSADLGKLEAEEVVRNADKKEVLGFTKRQWRDTKETMSMLEKSLLNFSGSINPITVQTMQLLAGDESLQFRFVNNKTSPSAINHTVVFNPANKVLTAAAGIIQHMTLGINTLKKNHEASEYKFWDVGNYDSPPLDPDEPYYLYARVSRTDSTGEFLLSETSIKMDAESDTYHLLVGILNSEYEGERSFVSLYGFTEILPGRVTTDKIVSQDGKTYFDLVNGIIAGRIRFINSDNEEVDIEDITGLDVYLGSSYYGFSTDASGFAYAKTINVPVYAYRDGVRINIPPNKITRSSFVPYGMNITFQENNIRIQVTTNFTPIPEGIDFYVEIDGKSYTLPFLWDRVKDGDAGSPGQSSYTHVRYSQNANGNPMTTNSVGAKYIGIAITTSPVAPTGYNSYSWTLIKGDDGSPGAPGTPGRGVVSITEEYYLSTSPTSQTGGTWSSTQPQWQEDKWLWVRLKVTFTDGVIAYTNPIIRIDPEALSKANQALAITDKFGTDINGALITTVMMLLREANSEINTAGISGIQGELRDYPAFWAGSDYAKALALINFLNKVKGGITPGTTEYANLAPITMLHNGAAKVGSFLIEKEGRIMLVDPATGKPRLVFDVTNLESLSGLVNGATDNGTTNIGSGSRGSAGVTTLSGSKELPQGASATFGSTNLFISADGRAHPNGMSSYARVTVAIYRNGVLYMNLGSTQIFFTSQTSVLDTSSVTTQPFTLNNLPAGTYTFRLIAEADINVEIVSATSTSTTFTWQWTTAGVRYFQFGLNGMMAFFSNNHWYFTENDGFDLRGKTNMPGVLLSGTVSSEGGGTNFWGAKQATSPPIRNSTGRYTVYHTIGHDRYSVSVLPKTANRSCHIVSQSSTNFVVEFRTIGSSPALADTAFTIQVTGDNY